MRPAAARMARHVTTLPKVWRTSQPIGPHEVESSRSAPGSTARTTPTASSAPAALKAGLRVERYAVEPKRLFQSEHQVHVLKRVRGLALHQVVDAGHHDEPLVLGVHEHGDVAEVAAVHRLR